MVKHRARCWKDDGDQVSSRPVSAHWIMSQPTFALGAADARASRGIHRDYDLWDIDGASARPYWAASDVGCTVDLRAIDTPARSP